MKLSSFAIGIASLCVTGTGLANEYVFAAPPRESIEKERIIYQPIVDLISKATGEKFVFRYTDNWLTYDTNMQKDQYDVVFDGPHFIGWRMAKLGHTPLVRLAGNLSFVLIARNDNPRVKDLRDLAGRSICGFAPPNLATLTLYGQFDNPARQPRVVEIKKGFKESFDGVISKRCDGGVLQATLYGKFNEGPHKGQTRVLFKSAPVPNQGFSAGKRIPPEIQRKIAQALLSPEGQVATKGLREAFKEDLAEASREEYQGLGVLLKDVWGFAL